MTPANVWVRTQDVSEAQAGFFFALQTLTRSAPHRTIVAIAMAVGLTHAVALLLTVLLPLHPRAVGIGRLGLLEHIVIPD